PRSWERCHESFFFFSSRRRHTRFSRDWSSDVCSSDLELIQRIDVLPLQQQLHELAAPQPAANRQVEHPAWRDKLLRAWERFKQKIGRASCRERVEISVVAVAVKKRQSSEDEYEAKDDM